MIIKNFSINVFHSSINKNLITNRKWTVKVHALIWWSPWSECCCPCLADFHSGSLGSLAVANIPDLSVGLRSCLSCCMHSVYTIQPPVSLLFLQSSSYSRNVHWTPGLYWVLRLQQWGREVPRSLQVMCVCVLGGGCGQQTRQWQFRDMNTGKRLSNEGLGTLIGGAGKMGF